MRNKRTWTTALGLAALVAAAVQLEPREVTAADHGDSPMAAANAAADIADFYAWETSRGTVAAVITFAAGIAPGGDPLYDDSILYTIHIDNTADPAEVPFWQDNGNDNASDIQILVRFGQNNVGDWGVQLVDVPGSDDVMVGPVGEDIVSGAATAVAGMYDDPFFFDGDGFNATIAALIDPTEAADVMFSGLGGDAVDTFAGTNTMAIVVEFDAAIAAGAKDNTYIQMWATTGQVAR
ncbi:MAG: DUF4331 domain-containing protein [Deltaproteobacteria bacterium]|nr:DUF4331 domain-containing protein [Deltaproteobacteria bacterium]